MPRQACVEWQLAVQHDWQAAFSHTLDWLKLQELASQTHLVCQRTDKLLCQVVQVQDSSQPASWGHVSAVSCRLPRQLVATDAACSQELVSMPMCT